MRALVVALVLQLVLAGGFLVWATQGFPWFGTATRYAPVAHRFDSARAFADVRMQVKLGPRIAGSAAARKLAVRLKARLPHGHFEAIPGRPRERNVVGTLPGRKPAIVIGGHYDTYALVPHFVGAVNGGSGTAILLELARVLAKAPRPGGRELRFVAFDGEELPKGTPESEFLKGALRGSRAYVKRHSKEVGQLLLLDYVGNRGISLPREGNSDVGIWARIRAAARRAGFAGAFPDTTGPQIFDDHTPFLEAGIPAVDFIDWSYEDGHKPSDTLDKVSPKSLDAVGETVLEYLRGLSPSLH